MQRSCADASKNLDLKCVILVFQAHKFEPKQKGGGEVFRNLDCLTFQYNQVKFSLTKIGISFVKRKVFA